MLITLRQRWQTLLCTVFMTAAGWALFVAPLQAAPWLDDQPRIAIMSAFEPELALLRNELDRPQTYRVNGLEFTTGELRGKPAVLFLSGISMTNAAMNTQLALDRFKITRIVFSGIAGGVNPHLNIGDVTVVQRWGQYLEMVLAKQGDDGSFVPPAGKEGIVFSNFDMMFPREVRVRSEQQPDIHRKFWFDVDSDMLATAERLEEIELEACNARGKCLSQPPQVVIGGNGVSGSAFVDNARFRQYAYDTFQASVLDMESAACAMVAYSNGVPFIAFRALSDLAGGGKGENEMATFMDIAAENSARVVLAFLEAL